MSLGDRRSPPSTHVQRGLEIGRVSDESCFLSFIVYNPHSLNVRRAQEQIMFSMHYNPNPLSICLVAAVGQ